MVIYEQKIILSLLIFGPKQLDNDIYVYLAHLSDDLKLFWEKWVLVFDVYGKIDLTMQAIIFCMINSFSTYVNLLGYLVKGKKGMSNFLGWHKSD